MDFHVIRSQRQLLDLFDQLKNRRLPMNIAVQEIRPVRSIDLNDYLWGFVYTPIAQYTGHTILEVHETFKKMFGMRCDITYNSRRRRYEFVVGIGSTASMTNKELWDYAAEVRAHAELELHLTIHLPKECFVSELCFKNEIDYEQT